MADLGERRIAEMDEAGIDVQVISHGPPGAQGVRSDRALAWSRADNDGLQAAIARHPTRFAGFASIPTADPAAGAAELERPVTPLGSKVGMIHSLGAGPFLDEQLFWTPFARAAALALPISPHPADPTPPLLPAYYRAYES